MASGLSGETTIFKGPPFFLEKGWFCFTVHVNVLRQNLNYTKATKWKWIELHVLVPLQRRNPGKMSYNSKQDRALSHDIMAAIMVPQNNEMPAMFVLQNSPVGVALCSYLTAFFYSKLDLHKFCPHE